MKKCFFLICVIFVSTTFVKAFSFDINALDFNQDRTGLSTTYTIPIFDFSKEEEEYKDIKDLAKEILTISFEENAQSKLADFMYVNSSNGFETINASIFISSYLEELSSYSISYDYIKIIRVISFSEGDIAFVYLDDVMVNDTRQDVIFAYWFKENKLFYPRIVMENDLSLYFASITEKEDLGEIDGGSYKGISLLKNNKEGIDSSFLSTFFSQHVNSNVQITGLKQDGVSSYGSGFFISEGVVVTSWSFLLSMLQEQSFIYVTDAKGHAYQIEGVVSLQALYDVVVLKLKEEAGYSVVFGDSTALEVDAPLFLINSQNNQSYSIRYGSFVTEEKGRLQNLFALHPNDVGSALYNKEGYVVGMNTATILYSEQSIANSTNYLIDLQTILQNTGYQNIESTSLDLFYELYYYPLQEEEKKINVSLEEIHSMEGIGNIKLISIPLIKTSKEDHILSLRYKNTIESTIDTMYLVAQYEESLVNTGYQLHYSSQQKKIYVNEKYKIILKANMNYFILLIMER